MSRDHAKLRVFHDAHRLTLDSSACELKYLATLTSELGYVNGPHWADLLSRCDSVVRQLERLVQRMVQLAETED